MIDAILLQAVVFAGPATAGTAAVVHAQVSASQIPSRWQRFARCVSERESHGNYKARNRSENSSAMGRWQFLDRQWRRGLSFMVRDRLIEHGTPKAHANSIQRKLAKTPIQKWAPWAQDAGFVAVITADEGRGWRHWSNGGKCDRLAVAR